MSPQPSPEEVEALDEALVRLVAEPEEEQSAWWRQGIRENVLGEAVLGDP